DGVSWRVLLEDLETAYQQLESGRSAQFPPKTTSYRAAATRFKQVVAEGSFDSELDSWRAPRHIVAKLPKDLPNGRNTEGSAAIVSISLNVDETHALLHDVPKAYNTQVNDVLLTALLQAFSQWTGNTGLLIDLEGHGRTEMLEDVDLSRTVGCFTALFPVSL